MQGRAIAEVGCLCGGVRCAVNTEPIRVTVCHCRFCQRATGAAYAVLPVFPLRDFEIIKGEPSNYLHRSEGSGKMMTINFCANCGAKLYITFERYPDIAGIYSGAFDDPNWFERKPEISKQIFLEAAQRGTIIPAGIKTYRQHATLNDGTPLEPVVFDEPLVIGPGL